MRLNRLLIVAFIGLLGFGSPVPAKAYEQAQSYVQAQFLPPQLLTPPPAEATPAWTRQIDAVLKAQHAVSAKELSAMKDEQNLRLELMTSVLGASFTRERLPKTFAMLDRVMSGTGEVVNADKQFWHTRRPYLADPRVKLNVDPINESPAYPSGHAAGARVSAEVLGMLVPDKLGALRAKADAIAHHRVEAGVHYPNDIEGGRALAMLIVGALTANEDFEDDLAASRKELATK